jgi:hypothetical protein
VRPYLKAKEQQKEICILKNEMARHNWEKFAKDIIS